MTKRFLCGPMTLLIAGVRAGFSLQVYSAPAGTTASRSAFIPAWQLRFLGIALTRVQAFDGVIGALARDPSKVSGPFASAVLNALVGGCCESGRVMQPSQSKGWPLLDQSTLIRERRGQFRGQTGPPPASHSPSALHPPER
jgi:hypothetical protein